MHKNIISEQSNFPCLSFRDSVVNWHKVLLSVADWIFLYNDEILTHNFALDIFLNNGQELIFSNYLCNISVSCVVMGYLNELNSLLWHYRDNNEN